jgi:hypothetical protein
VEDKVAEEIILGARRHLFLCNNLFSVLNHVRDMIDKADEAVNGKVRRIGAVCMLLSVIRRRQFLFPPEKSESVCARLCDILSSCA